MTPARISVPAEENKTRVAVSVLRIAAVIDHSGGLT